jgi:transketolase
MRKQLCDALLARADNPKMVFLTGDLGFMAFEPLRALMGERFINAGVAEQNMISVAAALARQDFEVWVYSIAPFVYARPFEQIRNDITFHNLPVKLIGNGGGYGYGVMGPTHHAIDDYGVLLTLPNMGVYVPAFDEDVGAVVNRAALAGRPVYLRIGRGESPAGYLTPSYEPWRQLTFGAGPVMIVVGPVVGSYIDAVQRMTEADRPNLWSITELPIEFAAVPQALYNQIEFSSGLWVIEEHVKRGGFASELMLHLASKGIFVKKFTHLYASAHHFDRYGSQSYLRIQSGLDVDSILGSLTAN